MAEDNVGGISVSFTADAAQLQAEIARLETQLKRFNASFGQQKVQLQLAAPSRRNMLDTRREISQAFTARGSAGQIMAKVAVQAPTSRDLQTFRAQLGRDVGSVKVKVIGNFEWGQKPPTSITIPVTPAGGGGAAARAPLAGQQPAQARAAAPAPAPTRGGRPPSSSTARAAAQVQTVSGQQLFSKSNGWNDQTLLEEYLQGGGNADYRRKLKDELRRRGYDPDQQAVNAASRRPAARGFVSQYMGQALPRPGQTGVRPLTPIAIRRMQTTGELPLPYADIYHPAYKSGVNIGARNFPPEEQIRSAVRETVRRMPEAERARGMGWWPGAGQLIAGIGAGSGQNANQLAGVAALGTTALDWPGTIRNLDIIVNRWREGIRDYETLFKGTQLVGRERRDAFDIMQMANPTREEVLAKVRGSGPSGRPKVTEMYGGFLGDPNAMPLDRHMQELLFGGSLATKLIPRGREIVIDELKKMGRQPAGTMAGMWTTMGGGEPFGADPYGQLGARAGGARGFAGWDPYANWQRQQGREANRRMLAAKNPYGMPGPRPSTNPLDTIGSPERRAVIDEYWASRRTGGARGFSDFDPFGRQAARQPITGFMAGRAMGTVPAVGGTHDIQGEMQNALVNEMRQRLSAGGFTYNPATGEFLVGQPGKKGPFLAATGQSVSGPASQLAQLRKQLEANPANARLLRAGGLIGGWQNPETGMVDLDVSRAYASKRSMLRALGRRPDQMAGFDLGTGQDIANPAYVPGAAAPGLSPAQLAQRRRNAANAYRGPGGQFAARPPTIVNQPATAMAADLPWDEEGRLPGDEGYGTHARAYGLMSPEEALLDAPVVGGKRGGRGKPLPGGLQRKARISPAARAETIQFDANLQEAQKAQEQFQERQIRTARASAIRSIPTTLAGILSGGLGGARAQEQSKQATQAVNAHRAALKQLTDAQTEENEIAKRLDIEKPGSEAHKFLTERLKEQRVTVKDLTAAEKDLRIQADELTATANKAAGTGLRNLAAGFASNLAAGLAFGVGFSALQGIITGVSQGLAPAVARLTNFSEVAGETSKNLAEVTRQAGGRPELGVSQVFAQTGLKGPVAEQLRPELERIASIQAGASAFRDQQALIQTAFNFRNAQGIPGITASTGGGLFGIGSEKGIVENLKEQIQGIAPETGGNRRNQIRSAEDLQAQNEQNAKTLDLVNQQLSLFGISLEKAADTEAGRAAVEQQRQTVAALGGQAGGFADVLATRGLTLTDREGKLLTGDELQDAVINGLKDLPKQSAAELVRAMRPQIEAQRALFRLQSDFQRDQLNPAQFALQLAAQPLTRADSFGERPRNALTGRGIPIQPLFRGAFGQQGGEVGAQFTAAFESLGPLLDKTDDRLMDLREDGQRALEALVPADQIVEFRALNREITNVGATIAGLQLGVQQEQVNLQIAQYNNQLRIARRSQTDLLQLTGQMGATQGDNLGLLQRQMIMYERQTQELSLQSNELQLQSNTLSIILAQRQINFQRSLAGFVTPGETPQEIAARAREAEIEARFAQRQLDIQKEQLKLAREQQGIAGKALPLQFEIQDIGFQRQLTDINAEIALLNQGIQLTVNTAAAERAIAHLTALENELVKRAGTYVDEGAKAAGAFMEGVAQVKAATVDGMDTVIRQTANAWNIFIRQGVYAVGALTGGPGLPPPASNYGERRNQSGTLPGGVQRAAGFYGMFSSATQMTVGEAGPETVAILRNPRSWTPPAPSSGGWGGGGGNITVMVTGNQIGGSEQDQERFAAIIARKVEEIQSRRGSLLGLRSL